MANDGSSPGNGESDGRGRSEGSRATQFTVGDGRRRPGRPKGAKSLRTIYQAVSNAKIPVTMGGKTRKLTKTEAIILKQAELALKGEQRPAERFLDKVEQYSPIEAEPDLTAALMSEDQDILRSAMGRGLLRGAEAGRADSDNDPEPPVASERRDDR